MATTALVSVATGVMKPLLSKITKLLVEEHSRLKGVREHIKFLEAELTAASSTLEILADSDQHEQLHSATRIWRDTLRELAYDLEDCIDAFRARVDHEHNGHSRFKQLFDKLKKLKARHEIANQIQELMKRVIEASDRRKRYNSVEIPSRSRTYCGVDPRLPVFYVEIDKLIGIDGPMKHIIEWLTMENKASSAEHKVLSIVGCGGLGKTTLANQVYLNVKSQFSCAAFVSVSQNPDLKRILKNIAKEIGITDNILLDDDEKQLIDKIRKRLQDERYLIVFDDLWDAKPWETIKLALVRNCESRVITTTRSIAVASCLSSQGGYVYQMKSLSFEDSKKLLFRRAFGSENLSFTHHLGSVPDDILRKCDGLPLAIITISSMLADKHAKCEWNRILNDIGSALAMNRGAEKMTIILSMSYFDIPHHLRTCLLYLSVFPEDYQIEKQRLINRWIAEGFIPDEEGLTKYEIGEGYFNDLINRSMIQPVDVKYGQAKACRVHDIILDYIKCKAAEVNFVTLLDAAEQTYTSEHKVRRIYVSNHKEEHVSLWASPILAQVRSLTIFGLSVKTSLLPSTALRVLDLGDCEYMENHNLSSIEKLFHLKYLCLHSRSITELPEKIGELQCLQTLDVRGTNIKELPSTISKLQRLAHLYVDYHVSFPDGIIGQMHSLEELREYGVKTYEQGESLKEFNKLNKLRTLKIKWYFDLSDGSVGLSQAEDFKSYIEAFLSTCNIYNLYITDLSDGHTNPESLDSWHPAARCSLQKLCIKFYTIYNVPNWMGSLGNLTVLRLNSIICLRPEDVEILGAIPSLLFLTLETTGGSNGRIIVHGSNGFRCLKYLSMRILYCGTSLKFEAGSMPRLEYIKLVFYVHEIDCLNGASSLGIQHLSALTKVEVEIYGNCTRDLNYNPMEDKNDGAVRSVANAINCAIVALPNRPTVRFKTVGFPECNTFKRCLREANQKLGGLANEWLKIWQIEEKQMEQATDGRLN